MSGKHVVIARRICKVCGIEYKSDEILLHKKLRDIPEDKAVIGMGLCPEHQRLFDEGYLALVAIDPFKSNVGSSDHEKVTPKEAFLTGQIVHVHRSLADSLFNVDIPESMIMVYTDETLIARLQEMEGDVPTC